LWRTKRNALPADSVFSPQQILFGWSNREEWFRRSIWRFWEREVVYTGIRSLYLR
jgi:hypothetical protein